MARGDTAILDPARLTAIRLGRGLTRRELAARAGVCELVVWRAHNRRVLSLASARAIARALRVPLRRLLGEPAGPDGAEAERPADSELGKHLAMAAFVAGGAQEDVGGSEHGTE
jgi:transcriptional regulator with XRE-family HTH domain